MNTELDTIVAIATAPGKSGVGIVRLSGANAFSIAKCFLGFPPKPRYAHYAAFRDKHNDQLDQGIAIYFAAPNSFTGEDVFELQAHGGPVILDMILKSAIEYGARIARPGEFSERAFLNDKLDLVQAEAIADLINCESEQAVRSALNSLQGEFSKQINELREQLIELRMYVESAIDFPEEEIDFLADGYVSDRLNKIIQQVQIVFSKARQGSILREGMKVVIAGRPNAGKSSLLNALAEKESAIVTAIEGTTRDILKEHILIDGMPLHIIDTAGLREDADEVESIGIQKALVEIESADRILLLVDASHSHSHHPGEIWPEFLGNIPSLEKVTVIRNKIDKSQEASGIEHFGSYSVVRLSAKNGDGLEFIRAHLKEVIGFNSMTEGTFIARRRHLTSLQSTLEYLNNGKLQLDLAGAGELLAEDLRVALDSLGEITGEFSSDDLLGKIFSSFCVGK